MEEQADCSGILPISKAASSPIYGAGWSRMPCGRGMQGAMWLMSKGFPPDPETHPSSWGSDSVPLTLFLSPRSQGMGHWEHSKAWCGFSCEGRAEEHFP